MVNRLIYGTSVKNSFFFIFNQSVKTFRIRKMKVSKSVAQRKEWKKFGEAANDPPGPNPSNTYISEEITMQFMQGKDVSAARFAHQN